MSKGSILDPMFWIGPEGLFASAVLPTITTSSARASIARRSVLALAASEAMSSMGAA